MSKSLEVIAGVGLADRRRKSRWPARMDFLQSATGLALGLFMWGHMLFVASILISNDFMWRITKLFEGYYFFGKSYPGIVSASSPSSSPSSWSTRSWRCASSPRTTVNTGRSSATGA